MDNIINPKILINDYNKLTISIKQISYGIIINWIIINYNKWRQKYRLFDKWKKNV